MTAEAQTRPLVAVVDHVQADIWRYEDGTYTASVRRPGQRDSASSGHASADTALFFLGLHLTRALKEPLP